MKKLIEKPFKEIRIPVLYFKRTQEEALQNINILAALDGNLYEAIEAQKGIPLDYGS